MSMDRYFAIQRVLEKRKKRGASAMSLRAYLLGLRRTHTTFMNKLLELEARAIRGSYFEGGDDE